MGSTWKNQWSVGNAIIDSEHRNLLAMACDIEERIKHRDISAVWPALDQFESWLCTHFENEEEIALAIGYTFYRNRVDHQKLLQEYHTIRNELISYGNTLSESGARRYAHFLGEWLVVHIINEDMRMKPMLQVHPYDYLPGRK